MSSNEQSPEKTGANAGKVIEKKFAQQSRMLEAASRDLDALIYVVSHDLRAPLRHIDGFMTMFRKRAEAQLDEESRRFLDKISTASGSMAEMIRELLAFSRDTGGELKRNPVALNTVIQAVIGDLANVIGERRIDWLVSDLPTVWADRVLLRRAMHQLMSNAVKFSRQCPLPRIEITAEEDGENVVLCVRDNGAGFDMAYTDKLFRLFQRLHTEHEYEGAGTGLAIVARIVGRHGGRVWADAVAGQGARFFVELPVQT
ncbi:MAG: ATP-binding protein [Burkholderiales bacterium]